MAGYGADALNIHQQQPSAWPLLLAAFAVLGVSGFSLQFSTGIDDAHITYFASHMLANQSEILNYNLERIEQSSSLLHVILGALLSKITGMSAVAAGRVIPMLAGLLCLLLLNIFAIRQRLQTWPVMLCASTSSFVYWNFAGLEAPLAALLLLTYILLLAECLQNCHWRNILLIIAAGTGLQMVRPEMVLFAPALTISTSVFLFSRKQSQIKTVIVVCIISLACAMSISLWRHWYFGDWFPQPVTAKSSGITLTAIHNGLQYVAQMITHPWTTLPVLIGIFASIHIMWRAWRHQVSTALISMSIAVIGYSALIILMGGDWMPAGRLWVYIIPLAAMTISYSFSILLPAKSFTRAMVTITVLNITGLISLAYSHITSINNMIADRQTHITSPYSFFELHSPDNLSNIPTLEFLQPLLSQLLQRQPGGITIMSGQMGMIPYHVSLQYPGKIRFTDRNALIDRKLTECAITRDLPRAQQGLDGLSTVFFLKKSGALQQQCNIQPADIIFDLWWHHLIPETTEMLARHGYTVVFVQQGHTSSLQDQLVAVRTELWATIAH
ncbi:MAG TPA: hypothetical protein VLB90_10340 [Pseudomonadales bacterium]|nr:hypothetical protein [Pseudomonadales bacterium]